MSRFVLTAQLQLQAPSNTRQVVQQIQRQLQGGVNLNVQLQNAPAAQRQLTQINKQVSNLNTQGKNLSKNFGISIRRFASFTIASRAVSLFTNKLAGAVDEAIKFEREIVKIAQVTGKSVQSLDGLTKTISNLSTNLGVASSELVGTTRILAQAGIKANDLEVALAALAKTTLAPTFEDINKTAEGAVAILAQFGRGVGALEDQLGSINKVAGQFAVESGDLISAVRRFGGVFKSAGGELDELLGLFTSVRATTRESAESIATGLRTIFTRIQRPKTIEFLKQFGVQLTDLEGKFVGPFEAVRQLSQAFAGLEEGDITFVRVAEELGGFRQIGKVIPLIQQFTVAEKARQAALEGRGSLDDDAAKAQQALAVQIQKVREEFFALIRGISETGTFQVLVKSTLALTSQLIKLADAFKPLIPLLTAFAGIKIASNIGNIARGIGAGVLGRNQGGPIGFARGGVVPGQGNRDTVPAMLTPGEFVIRKSSVNKIGSGTLAAMNENRFENGGKARRRFGSSTQNSGKAFFGVKTDKVGAFFMNPAGTNDPKNYSANQDLEFVLTNENIKRATGNDPSKTVNAVLKKGQYSTFFPSLNDVEKGLGPNFINPAVATGISSLTKSVTEKIKSANIIDFKPAIDSNDQLLDGLDAQVAGDKGLVSTIAGYVFEGVITALTGAKTAGGNANFDFPAASLTGNRDKLANLFGNASLIRNLAKADAKATAGADKFNVKKSGNIPKKVVNDINDGILSGVQILKGPASSADDPKANRIKRASGGGVPSSSDTVPALLTPGEFVINKKAAQKIGAGNLNRMNKQGVVGFAAGGPVTPNRHLYGNGPLDGELIIPGNTSISTVGNRSISTGGGPSGGGILREFVDEMDNATGGLIDLQVEMENFKKLIMNVLKGIADANRKNLDKQSTGFTMEGGSPVKSPDRFKKGPAGLLTGPGESPPAGDKKQQKPKPDAAKETLGDLGSVGIKLLAVNAALTPFITSGEEAAKNTFNFANALQAGVTQFIAVKTAMKAIEEQAKKNLKADDSNKGFFGNVLGAEVDKESDLGKFFEGAREKGLKREKRGADLQARGQARIKSSRKGVRGLGDKALGKSQKVFGSVLGKAGKGLGKMTGFVSKFAAIGLRGLPVIGQIIGGFTSLSSALSAGFAFQEKYNLAIKQGNVAKAQEYAALKDFTGIEQALGQMIPALADASAFIRGTTIESLKANAKFAALAAKADLEKADNARLASDAMKEVAAGTMSLTDALSGAGSANFRGQLDARRAALNANRLNSANRSEGGSGVLRSIGSVLTAGLLVEGRNAKNERIKSENEDRDRKSRESLAKEFESLLPEINKLGREFAIGGGTLAEFEAKLTKMGIPLDEVKGASERVARAFQNNVDALRKSREAYQALNFGLTPLLKTTDGLNTGLNTLTDISNGTYNALNNAKSVLETAATGGAVDDKAFENALNSVEENIKDFGGGEQVGKITKTITALREAFSGAGPALEEFRAKLVSGEIDAQGDPQGLIKGLTDTLTAGMDGESKSIIEKALGDLKLDPKVVEKIIQDGNLDELLKTLEEKGQEAFKDLGPLIDNIVTAQNSLLGLTKKRIAAEQELINAQLNSADLQREAANLIAEFAGKQLSGDEQASLAAGRLRATGINAQDASSLSATLAFNSIAQQGNVASLSDTQNPLSGQDRAATEAQQQKLNTQNAEILTYARERVKIYQQEIAVAKQRLKLEQDAAQALLAGDVTKFAENINASIAASAFRSGDTASLQALDGEAVAAGFGSLTDAEKRAAKPQLEALGLSSGLADSAAGTSPEIQALQAEATEYAQIIAQSGDAGVRLADASLTAAQNIEELGKQALETAQNKAAEQQAEFEAKKKEADAAAAKVEADRKAREEAEKAAEAADNERRANAAQAEADAIARSGRLAGGNSVVNYGQVGQVGDGSDGWMGYVEGFMGLNRRNLQVRARGGTIYASRGMFIPKGTDTVPAMLTPGEFVVNRAAVQRGNNLQILRSMNGGDTAPNGAPAAMSKGGSVGYYNQGGEVTAGMGDFINGMSQAISQLGGAFGTFSQSVQQLANMKLSVNLSPTRVDVNVIGPMLSELTEATKEVVLNAVVSEIQLNQLGQLERTV